MNSEKTIEEQFALLQSKRESQHKDVEKNYSDETVSMCNRQIETILATIAPKDKDFFLEEFVARVSELSNVFLPKTEESSPDKNDDDTKVYLLPEHTDQQQNLSVSSNKKARINNQNNPAKDPPNIPIEDSVEIVKQKQEKRNPTAGQNQKKKLPIKDARRTGQLLLKEKRVVVIGDSSISKQDISDKLSTFGIKKTNTEFYLKYETYVDIENIAKRENTVVVVGAIPHSVPGLSQGIQKLAKEYSNVLLVKPFNDGLKITKQSIDECMITFVSDISSPERQEKTGS